MASKETADQQQGPRGRERLLLLDGHSLAYRAFFALPAENFSTTTGQPTNAVYGFTAMLINVLRDEQPTRVAVAFDRGEPTFRHEQYVEYKATRKETPADFRSQLSLIFEVLDALGIRRLSVPGYEADDIIATLATEAAGEMDVLIVTGDRDALQLVTDDVTVLYTMRGISEMARFTPEAVQAKYGLSPSQYPDFAALRGDPSDNLPGIPGVGEKTATKWIAEFGSLAQLVDRVDEVKGKAGDALREHLAGVLRNSQLTQLVRDMTLEVGPADLAPAPWDREQIHQLFDTLQFRVLRDRLYSTLPNGIGGPAAPAAGTVTESTTAFDVAATVLGSGRGRGLAGRARGPGPGRAGPERRVGPGHGQHHRHRDRGARCGGLPGPDDAHRGRRQGPRQLAVGPGSSQGAARRQGAHARARGARARPGRAHQRYRARRLSRAAGPAVIRPGRPRAAVPEPGAARRDPAHRAADAGRARRRRDRRPRWPSARWRPGSWPTRSTRT